MRWVAGALATAAALVACVPATKDLDPRGAAGARLLPNAAAAGAPFTTSDGWTITIERLALVGRLSVIGPDFTDGGYVVWNAAQKAETWVPAFPISSTSVDVQLEGLYYDVGQNPEEASRRLGDVLSKANVAPDVAARVFTVPDNATSTFAISTEIGQVTQGPAIMFAARATRGAETMHLALNLAAPFRSSADPTRAVVLNIVENDVRFAEFEVRPERIFAAGDGDTTLLFEPLADADRHGNKDGIISGAELHAVSLNSGAAAPSSCEDEYGFLVIQCASLLDLVADNALGMIEPLGVSR